MNKEKIHAVADAIANASKTKVLGFNMGMFGSGNADEYPDLAHTECGTTACIAGWAAFLNGEDPKTAYTGTVVDEFGIDWYQANDLVYATRRRDKTDLVEISPKRAVAVLRHLAESGEVAWDRFNNAGRLRK